MPHSTARQRMPAVFAMMLVLAALGAFLLLTALGVEHRARTAQRAPYTLTPFATYSTAAPHVESKLLFNSAQAFISGASRGASGVPVFEKDVLDLPEPQKAP